MVEPWVNWLAGLIFSLGFGHVGTVLFLKYLRSYMKLGVKPGTQSDHKEIPPWLMGTCERFIFTMAVAFGLSGTVVGMMAWLGLKMATYWNRPGFAPDKEEEQFKRIRFALSAALAGLISMTFALIGGLICNGEIPWLTAIKWAL